MSAKQSWLWDLGSSCPVVLCYVELHDLLPSILPQLGADNMNTLRKLAEEGYGAGGAGGFGRGPTGGVGTIEEEDEEDDGAYHLACTIWNIMRSQMMMQEPVGSTCFRAVQAYRACHGMADISCLLFGTSVFLHMFELLIVRHVWPI